MTTQQTPTSTPTMGEIRDARELLDAAEWLADVARARLDDLVAKAIDDPDRPPRAVTDARIAAGYANDTALHRRARRARDRAGEELPAEALALLAVLGDRWKDTEEYRRRHPQA